MEQDTCEVCGERVVAGVQFCTSCGSYLGWREPGSPRETTAPATTAPASTASPTTAQPDGPVSPAPIEPAASPTQSLTPSQDAPAAEVGTLSTATAGARCPQCATTNDAGRRFCIKCGYFVGSPTPSSMLPRPAAAPKTPWWRRWLPHRSEADRRARSSFRKSLPVWIRLRRWFILIAVVVLVGAFLHFVGRDPIAWAKQQIYALRGTVVAAENVTASSDPKTADPKGANAARAADDKPDTAWTTTFAGGTAAAGAPCARTADQTALDLTSKSELTARAINIQAGLPDNLNRQAFWRPTVLDLEFSDGSCQSVHVQDVAGWQLVRFSAVRTTTVRITIAAANPPSGGSTSTQAAITEVQLMVRPS